MISRLQKIACTENIHGVRALGASFLCLVSASASSQLLRGDKSRNVARPPTQDRPVIFVLIPSVPRHGGVHYLPETLKSLHRSLRGDGKNQDKYPEDDFSRPNRKRCVAMADYSAGQVGLAEISIFVFNHAKPRRLHFQFENMTREGSSPQVHDCVHFVSEHAEMLDPFPELPGESERYEMKWNPEPQARQQTADTVSMLRYITTVSTQLNGKLPDYVLLWEDDVIACSGLWQGLVERITLLRMTDPTFASLQVGMGGSGLLIASGYVAHLAEYLVRRLTESAVDVLINAYMQSFSRPHFLSIQTLSHHIGAVSTFTGRGHADYSDCGKELQYHLSPNVFEECRNEKLRLLLKCDAKHAK